MEFGIVVSPGPDAWRVVKRAEELGFACAWFYDSQLLYSDVFVSMAQAAEHTERIRLATGTLIPSNRIAPVAANCYASLDQLAPGRIVAGIATGMTARQTMGLGPMRLGDLQEYVRVMRALWAGETPEWEFEDKRRKIRFLDPEASGFAVPAPIPVHVSAYGPKARVLAAEIGDGWLTVVLGGDEQSIDDLNDVRRTCHDRGHDAGTLYTTAFAPGCVLRPGEPADGPRARAQAGPAAAATLHNFVEVWERSSVPPPPDLVPVVEAYMANPYGCYEPADARYLSLHRGHLLYVREDEASFVTADLIRAATYTGEPDELRERIRALRDAGFDQWCVMLTRGNEDAIEDWAEVLEKV